MHGAELFAPGARPGARPRARPGARPPRSSWATRGAARRRVSPRPLLWAVVLAYLGVVLLGPPAALLMELMRVGIGAALAAVTRPAALDALGRSLGLVAIAVAVNAVVGTLGGIVLARHRFAGRALVGALCDLPLAVSPVMVGLAFVLLVGRTGLLSPALQALGMKVMFAYPGLLVATLFVTLPYTVREVALVLEEVGTVEEEAAITLGASPMQAFLRVTLPGIWPALGYGLLMTTARTLGEFGAVVVLGGSITGQTQTATTFIHDAIEQRGLAGAYGMAGVLATISVVLLLALEWTRGRRAGRSGASDDDRGVEP